MKREWKPGDVRLATVNGERMLVLRGRGIFEGNWYTQGPVAGSRLSVSDEWVLDHRPLVVIDPEDREQVERLSELFWAAWSGCDGSRSIALGEALDQFANPTPPKPDEPTGLGAVVATEEDGDFIRVSVELANPWLNVQTERQVHWDAVAAVRVLSPGVDA